MSPLFLSITEYVQLSDERQVSCLYIYTGKYTYKLGYYKFNCEIITTEPHQDINNSH